MSASKHQIQVRAVDQTAGAFASIRNRAAATGAQIRGLMGSALAAAGAYLGFRSVKGGIDELGHLSDMAMKTSMSVDELTATTAAFGALGLQNMGVEQLGRAMDYMAKTTGRSGLDGFIKTIGELGKIGDVAKRGQEAMRIFGRSGMELMPIVTAANESTEAIETVIRAMPGIPQSAADAGDAASDAMAFATAQMKSVWLQGLGWIANTINNDFTGDVRTAALRAGNFLEYYTKVAVQKVIMWYRKAQEWLKRFGDFYGALIGAKMGGASWGEAFDLAAGAMDDAMKRYEEVSAELDAQEEERTERWRKSYEDRAAAITHFADAYANAAMGINSAAKKDGGDDAERKKAQVRNDLIMGGSNESVKLAILGPNFQSESKRQTKLLDRIASNTEKTADNTEATAESSDDMEVIY